MCYDSLPSRPSAHAGVLDALLPSDAYWTYRNRSGRFTLDNADNRQLLERDDFVSHLNTCIQLAFNDLKFDNEY